MGTNFGLSVWLHLLQVVCDPRFLLGEIWKLDRKMAVLCVCVFLFNVLCFYPIKDEGQDDINQGFI